MWHMKRRVGVARLECFHPLEQILAKAKRQIVTANFDTFACLLLRAWLGYRRQWSLWATLTNANSLRFKLKRQGLSPELIQAPGDHGPSGRSSALDMPVSLS